MKFFVYSYALHIEEYAKCNYSSSASSTFVNKSAENCSANFDDLSESMEFDFDNLDDFDDDPNGDNMEIDFNDYINIDDNTDVMYNIQNEPNYNQFSNLKIEQNVDFYIKNAEKEKHISINCCADN